jgi:hypothetical protein
MHKGNYWILRLGVVAICRKLDIILENKVIYQLMLPKNVNNKKYTPKFIFFNEKKRKYSDDFWYRKLIFKVKFWQWQCKFDCRKILSPFWPKQLFVGPRLNGRSYGIAFVWLLSVWSIFRNLLWKMDSFRHPKTWTIFFKSTWITFQFSSNLTQFQFQILPPFSKNTLAFWALF